MPSPRGDALKAEQVALLEATRRGAAATSIKDVLAAADTIARCVARIDALNKIGLASTRLHAV